MCSVDARYYLWRLNEDIGYSQGTEESDHVFLKAYKIKQTITTLWRPHNTTPINKRSGVESERVCGGIITLIRSTSAFGVHCALWHPVNHSSLWRTDDGGPAVHFHDIPGKCTQSHVFWSSQTYRTTLHNSPLQTGQGIVYFSRNISTTNVSVC